MREIKFRGKGIRSGVWVYGGYFTSSEEEGLVTYIFDSTHGAIPVDPETVGQFTGLQDKNSKEIYEGDIVKGYQYGPDKLWIVELKISDFNCGFVGVNPNCDSNYIHMWYDNLEVVGNIYSNPELLEDK